METKLYPDAVKTESQYKPVLAHKADRKYKWKFILARRIAIALGVLLLGATWLLAITIRGNLTMSKQLSDSKTVINGRLK